MITLPTGMKLNDWADQVVFDLSAFGLPARLDGDDWVLWGQSLRNTVTGGQVLPDPSGFPTWLEWAERVAEISL